MLLIQSQLSFLAKKEVFVSSILHGIYDGNKTMVRYFLDNGKKNSAMLVRIGFPPITMKKLWTSKRYQMPSNLGHI